MFDFDFIKQSKLKLPKYSNFCFLNGFGRRKKEKMDARKIYASYSSSHKMYLEVGEISII